MEIAWIHIVLHFEINVHDNILLLMYFAEYIIIYN